MIKKADQSSDAIKVLIRMRLALKQFCTSPGTTACLFQNTSEIEYTPLARAHDCGCQARSGAQARCVLRLVSMWVAPAGDLRRQQCLTFISWLELAKTSQQALAHLRHPRPT